MEKNTSLLQSFWDLAAIDARERQQAASTLLEHIAQHTDDNIHSKSVHPDVEYALTRLIRGLNSGRDSARQGFSAALTELLLRFPSVATDHVLNILQENTQITAKMRGHEARDALFGRLFGYIALQRSGRLASDSSNKSVSGGKSSAKLTTLILKDLFEMARSKRWLREACFETLAAIVGNAAEGIFNKHLAITIAEELPGEVSDWSPEELTLVLALAATHSRCSEPAIQKLCTQLEESFSSNEGLKALSIPLLESTFTFPRLHCVWRHILERFVQNGALHSTPIGEADVSTVDAQASGRALSSFAAWWNTCVDTPLLQGTATHERKATALGLFSLVVRRASTEAVSLMLSPNMLRVLVANLPVKHNYLHKPAFNALKALQQTIDMRASSTFSASILMLLHGRNYSHFDQKTRTHLVQQLSKYLKPEELVAQQAKLTEAFAKPLSDDNNAEEDDGDIHRAVDTRRVWTLDALSGVVPDAIARGDETISAAIIRFMAAHALCDTSQWDENKSLKKFNKQILAGLEGDSNATIQSPPLSDHVRDSLRTKLSTTILDAINACTTKAVKEHSEQADSETEKLDIVGLSASGVCTWTAHVQEAFLAGEICLASRNDQGSFVTPLTEQQATTRKGALNAVSALRRAVGALETTGAADHIAQIAKHNPEQTSTTTITNHTHVLLGMASVISALSFWQLIEPVDSTALLDDLLIAMRAICSEGLLLAARVESLQSKQKTGVTPKKRGDSKNIASVLKRVESFCDLPVLKWAQKGVDGGRSMAMMVMLDCYLALLSFGNNFLKEAVKISARGLANCLTAGAVESLVSVVHEKLPEESTNNEEGESDEDMQADDDQEESEEEDNEDSESEDESLESENDKEDKEENDDDNSSVSSSFSDADASSQQMDRYDEMLAKMVSLRKEARVNAKRSREKELHFKYRALDLIDTLIQRLGGQTQLLLLAMPLLRCYRMLAGRAKTGASDNIAHGLSQRLFGILSKMCNKSKIPTVVRSLEHMPGLEEELNSQVSSLPVSDEEQDSASVEGEILEGIAAAATALTASQAHAGVAEALFLASSAPGSEFNNAASGVAWLLVRALRHTLEESVQADSSLLETPEKLTELYDVGRLGCAYSDALTSYLTHKNTRMSTKLFVPIFRYAPELGWSLAPSLAHAATYESTAPFRRTEAFSFMTQLAKAPLNKLSDAVKAVLCSSLSKDGNSAKGEFMVSSVDINPKVVGCRSDMVLGDDDKADPVAAGDTSMDGDDVSSVESDASMPEEENMTSNFAGEFVLYSQERLQVVPLSEAAQKLIEAAKTILVHCATDTSAGSEKKSKLNMNAHRQREVLGFLRAIVKAATTTENRAMWGTKIASSFNTLESCLTDLKQTSPSPAVRQLCTALTRDIQSVSTPSNKASNKSSKQSKRKAETALEDAASALNLASESKPSPTQANPVSLQTPSKKTPQTAKSSSKRRRNKK